MRRKIKPGNFWEMHRSTNNYYVQYYNRLTELSISMFKWENLPDTIDARYLELVLFGDGNAIFFQDEVMGYLCLRCAIGGQFNVYQVPTMRRAYAINGYQNQLDETNSVIIYNNMLRTPSTMDVDVFAQRLADLDKSIDMNARAQKTPILIQCDETQRLTMKNLYNQYEGNAPVIYGDKNLNPNGIKVLKTDAPYVADRLYALRTQIWNECLTYLGISNNPYEKGERMITDEVARAQGGTIASRYSRLNARRQACEQINKMFGLNIKCSYREDYRELSGVDDENALSETESPQGGMGESLKNEEVKVDE